jgi:hypothetical protein
MSIVDVIRWRVADKAIYPLIPASGSVLRAMFVTESLWTALNASYEDEEMEDRMGRLQADLEFFTSSPTIDPKYLFHLYPARDAVWEIRSVRDEPSIRVLGLFAQKDAFVATAFALRADLDGWQSRAWKQVKRTARQRWATLFNPYNPCVTTNVHDVVKGAANGKYFKTHP